ncbi:MAG: hypothetical protein GWM90_08620, partial [Gemmatimonadetes bacterium]|nr:hypothetical protein [Gemmatimonadota bacterium]NIQ53948.1 hypothetical protein [Gemmatimonadota bacterium]NIU74128.1 hypothetical protein [Gammaproteobacteria bacterium]NIX44174.1 hypothetical protein [Gemmatimonadota bacterium]NIY08398.1 hypothetical protein [Gemmatimonadota bacterium]
EDDYYRLIRAKTASLMSAACELGAMVGDERHREPLTRFGHYIGMAFQIADDLLDYTATEEATGKPTGHDLREHKMTLPLIAAMDAMDAGARREVEQFFASRTRSPPTTGSSGSSRWSWSTAGSSTPGSGRTPSRTTRRRPSTRSPPVGPGRRSSGPSRTLWSESGNEPGGRVDRRVNLGPRHRGVPRIVWAVF